MNKQLLLSILLLSTVSLVQAADGLSQTEIEANIAAKFGHLQSRRVGGKRIGGVCRSKKEEQLKQQSEYYTPSRNVFESGQQFAVDEFSERIREAEEAATAALFAGQKCAAKDRKRRLGAKKKTNRGVPVKTHSSLQQIRAGVGGYTNTGRDQK
jgi:hypothetical protein